MKKLTGLMSMAFLVAVLSGCTSYYEIKDPGTSAVYYTNKYKQKDSGAITFEDAKTKSELTLQNSQIKEISSDAWNAAVGG
jgi:hypothetical protein